MLLAYRPWHGHAMRELASSTIAYSKTPYLEMASHYRWSGPPCWCAPCRSRLAVAWQPRHRPPTVGGWPLNYALDTRLKCRRSGYSGIAHDIAHFAVSGVGYINPHLSSACSASDSFDAVVDLLNTAQYPEHLIPIEPLRLAIANLRVRFDSILHAHGLTRADVSEATLHFVYPAHGGDDFTCDAHARIVSSQGKVFTASVAAGV
jgi:hypothetical protein